MRFGVVVREATGLAARRTLLDLVKAFAFERTGLRPAVLRAAGRPAVLRVAGRPAVLRAAGAFFAAAFLAGAFS